MYFIFSEMFKKQDCDRQKNLIYYMHIPDYYVTQLQLTMVMNKCFLNMKFFVYFPLYLMKKYYKHENCRKPF